MRTLDEIVAHYQRSEDVLGVECDVLLPYLPVDLARPFFKADEDLSDWQARPLERDAVVAAIGEYLAFAWEKVADHRGLSAERNIAKMRAWLWLLGDEATLAYAEDAAHYPQYGAPILAQICTVYGFPIPPEPGIQRMIAGQPCRPDCDDGCGGTTVGDVHQVNVQIGLLMRFALTIPLDQVEAAISVCTQQETLMPLLDPTRYRREAKAIESNRELLTAFRTFRQTLERLRAREGP